MCHFSLFFGRLHQRSDGTQRSPNSFVAFKSYSSRVEVRRCNFRDYVSLILTVLSLAFHERYFPLISDLWDDYTQDVGVSLQQAIDDQFQVCLKFSCFGIA